MTETRDEAADFWDFSLEIYARPHIAASCIALQDAFGLDVNLMLLCLWVADRRSASLSSCALGQISVAVAPWNKAIVAPLRSIRRRLKAPEDLRATARLAQVCREHVMQAELDGERVAQRLLVLALADVESEPRPSFGDAAFTSLAAYAELLDRRAAAPMLDRLVKLASSTRYGHQAPDEAS